MKIEYIQDIDLLLSKIRKVKLYKSDFEVYRHSDITLRSIDPDYVKPCQHYVLGKQLEFINKFNRELKEQYGIYFTQLKGYCIIDNKYTITPPIIEYEGDDLIINDGMHRMYYCYLRGQYTNAIVIDNPGEVYYAYPIEWNEVRVLDKKPEFKKHYRIKRYKTLFRDFNTVFDRPVSVPR